MSDCPFTLDNCTYRNGETPAFIMLRSPNMFNFPILSITKDGTPYYHTIDGRLHVCNSGPVPYDLVLKPKERYWSKPEDVPTDIDRIRGLKPPSNVKLAAGAIVTAVGDDGIFVLSTKARIDGTCLEAGADLITWDQLSRYEHLTRGSNTWKPCKVEE